MKTIKPGMDGKQMKQRLMENNNTSVPLIKPSRKGLLHKKLGIPQGKKIPKKALNKALKSKSSALRKEANFAKNFGK